MNNKIILGILFAIIFALGTAEAAAVATVDADGIPFGLMMRARVFIQPDGPNDTGWTVANYHIGMQDLDGLGGCGQIRSLDYPGLALVTGSESGGDCVYEIQPWLATATPIGYGAINGANELIGLNFGGMPINVNIETTFSIDDALTPSTNEEVKFKVPGAGGGPIDVSKTGLGASFAKTISHYNYNRLYMLNGGVFVLAATIKDLANTPGSGPYVAGDTFYVIDDETGNYHRIEVALDTNMNMTEDYDFSQMTVDTDQFHTKVADSIPSMVMTYYPWPVVGLEKTMYFDVTNTGIDEDDVYCCPLTELITGVYRTCPNYFEPTLPAFKETINGVTYVKCDKDDPANSYQGFYGGAGSGTDATSVPEFSDIAWVLAAVLGAGSFVLMRRMKKY